MIPMSWIRPLIFFSFFLNLIFVFIVFVGYPLFLYIYSLRRKRPFVHFKSKEVFPFVSVIVVFRNAEYLIIKKIENFLRLDYPKNNIELILVSDGTCDSSLDTIQPYLSPFVRLFQIKEHRGKASGLNYGVEKSRGEILVFSDADSMIEEKSIRMLVRYFSDMNIGGVCGQRTFVEKKAHLKSGQMKYVEWDSMIKSLETRNGLSITSHDGKLYAIRKEMFKKVPDGVTDDAFISLSVIRQNFRFIFEPNALVFIKVPSRSAWHEVVRRIRIVSTSFNGLKMNRKLFNPFQFGVFAVGLFINKILRRLLPFSLIFLLLISFKWSMDGLTLAKIVLSIQIVGYSISFLYPMFCRLRSISNNFVIKSLVKLSEVGFYFCLGMIGTLLGLLFFLLRIKITKWEPMKK
jgi:cellulose synthase/poly-beta-1,6-N-acetylglucosamine synthase-like glycosyltransferase